jgi:hypothetical protein
LHSKNFDFNSPLPMNQQMSNEVKPRRGCVGCLRSILYITALLALILLAGFYADVFLPIVLVVLMVSLLLLFMKKRAALVAISIVVIATFIITLVVSVAAMLAESFDSDFENQEYVFNDPSTVTTEFRKDVVSYGIKDGVLSDSVVMNADRHVKHSRKWNDASGKRYSGHFTVSETVFNNAKKNRRVIYTDEGWGQVYNELVIHDIYYMKEIISMYDSIRNARNLNETDFANMIVSSVQSIPYALIVASSCQEPEVQEMVNEFQCSCLGNIRNYGIQSPIEFMYNQMGDCDTRAVFLYLVLKYFGYDVAVFVSEYYAHAVLAIHTNATGLYMMRDGKRYYFWETTAEGFVPGELSPGIRNTNFWNFALY